MSETGQLPFDPEKDGDFNWVDNEAIVITEQPETAVYFNAKGDLVIRQRSPLGEEDPFVYIAKSNHMVFLESLCDIIGIPSLGGGVK
jgi:hypothetical protein